MKRRIASIVTALALILSLCPAAAWAAESCTVTVIGTTGNTSITLSEGKQYVIDNAKGLTEVSGGTTPTAPYLDYRNNTLTVHGAMGINRQITVDGNLTITGDSGASLDTGNKGTLTLNGGSTVTLDGGVDVTFVKIAGNGDGTNTLTTTDDYFGAFAIQRDVYENVSVINVMLDMKNSGSITISNYVNAPNVPSMTLKSSGKIDLTGAGINCPEATIESGGDVRMGSETLFSGQYLYQGNSLSVKAKGAIEISVGTSSAINGSAVLSAETSVSVSGDSNIPITNGSLTVTNTPKVWVTGAAGTALLSVPVTFEGCESVEITNTGEGEILAESVKSQFTSNVPCVVNKGDYGDSAITTGGEEWGLADGKNEEPIGRIFEGGKQIYRAFNGGWVYYEPAADGNPGTMTLDGLTYNGDIDCGTITPTIVVKGINTIDFIKSQQQPEIHYGSIKAKRAAEPQTNKLNTIVVVGAKDSKTATVHGDAVLKDSFSVNARKTLTIPAGTSLTIDSEEGQLDIETPNALKIAGDAKIINHGAINLDGDAAKQEDIPAYIKGLNLTGGGKVHKRELNNSGATVPVATYSNSGVELLTSAGSLDFSDPNNTPTGEGFTWTSEKDADGNITSGTLTLAAGFNAQTLTLPDATVTIVTENGAECFVDTLTPPAGWNGGDPGADKLKLTVKGNGTLVVDKKIEISRGSDNELTVENGATLIANNGISIGMSGGADGIVTVNGTLIAKSAPNDSAIYTGQVAVGENGILEVSGYGGVSLNGMQKYITADKPLQRFVDAFTVTGDGRFTANCTEYNIEVVSPNDTSYPLDDKGNIAANKVISLTEEYLPSDCEAKAQGNNINLYKKGTYEIYTGAITIHKNHEFKKNLLISVDETYHGIKCDYDGCDVVKQDVVEDDQSNEKHIFEDGTCTKCGHVHTHEWSKDWESDATHHWHKCTNGECFVTVNSSKDGYGTHEYVDGVCKDCNYERSYTIRISDTVNGTVTADRTEAKAGETVTLTVAPAAGYEVNTLSVTQTDDTKVDVTTNTFTMPASAVTVTATFKKTKTEEPDPPQPTEYNVTVNVQPTGGGTVSRQPTSAVAEGTAVTLTATPDSGYKFTEWQVTGGNVTIADKNSARTTFTMPAANVTVTAVFEKIRYSVTVKDSENGTVTVDPKSATMGDTVTLTVTPNEGYLFKEWKVTPNNLDINSKHQFTMPDSNVTITAVFVKDDPENPLYSVTVKDDENGTVSVSSEKAAAGTEVTLTAKANDGYKFAKWQVESGNVTINDSNKNPVTFTMPNEAVTVKAVFEKVGTPPEPAEYIVTVNGSYATLSGAGKYEKGQSVTIKAGSRDDYRFNGWTSEDEVEFADKAKADTTFTMPEKDVTVTANWTRVGGGSSSSGSSTYAVRAETSAHGKVTADKSNSVSGGTVTLTVLPDSGYVLDTLTVTDSRGGEVKTTAQGGGKYTFTMPAGAVTVKAVFAPIPGDTQTPCDGGENCPSRGFTDLGTVGTWYHEAVDYVIENGLMGGYGNGLFGPDDALSRAQFVQILFNQAGRPQVDGDVPYRDVAAGAWYTDAVRWAASRGIADGYGDGRFGPDDPLTREQMAVMLWRRAGSPAATNKELRFTDAEQAGGYAREALRWAVESGILSGKGSGILDPKGLTTRAQAAQMLKNADSQ